MSKSLAAFLVVAGLFSGQGYSSPGRTNEAAGSTASTIFTSALTTSPDSSTTDTAASSYNTVTLYYCKTPTFSAIGPFVTIYNTVYIDVCSTGGLTQVTYTITDTCGCQHETDYTRPTGCPSGFTTTEKTCSMCSGSPVITCTTPIAPVSETSNPATAPAGSSQVSNTPYSQNPQYTNVRLYTLVCPWNNAVLLYYQQRKAGNWQLSIRTYHGDVYGRSRGADMHSVITPLSSHTQCLVSVLVLVPNFSSS